MVGHRDKRKDALLTQHKLLSQQIEVFTQRMAKPPQ